MSEVITESHPSSKSIQPRLEPISNQREEPVRFSHPAEEAFARVLDFYEIEWEYEPTTFPLEWDEEGRVITAFSPDFYLVEDDQYIELTTMKQKLVTQKNRKLRLLRELYPEARCKLVYRKDVENLAVKFGLFEDGPMPDLCFDAEGNDKAEEEEEL